MAPKGKAKSKQSHRKTTASTSTAVSSRIFPHEVVFHILSGLPVKTLLRFKCVCKQWRTLISLPAFISAHLRRSPASLIIHALKLPKPPEMTSHPQITIKPDGHNIYAYGPPNQQTGTQSTIDHILDFPGSDGFLQVVGSANGVVLMVKRPDARELTLWNPATRSSINIPDSGSIFNPNMYCGASAGLGFDPSLKEYKIIRILCGFQQASTGLTVPDSVEVFNFKIGRWKKLRMKKDDNNDDGPVRFRVITKTCEAVVKGVPYWTAWGDDEDLGYPIIRPMLLSLDVKNMVFNMEKFSWNMVDTGMRMGEIKDGCLGAIVWDVTDEEYEDRDIDVWMKQKRIDEFSPVWIKIYRVNEPRLVMGRVVGFYRRDGGDGSEAVRIGMVQDVGNVVRMINLDRDQNNMGVEDFFRPVNSWPGTFRATGYNESFTRLPRIGNALIH